jgi:hypothetical protein
MKKTLNSKNQGLIFVLLMEGSGSVQIITDPFPEAPKTYGSY